MDGFKPDVPYAREFLDKCLLTLNPILSCLVPRCGTKRQPLHPIYPGQLPLSPSGKRTFVCWERTQYASWGIIRLHWLFHQHRVESLRVRPELCWSCPVFPLSPPWLTSPPPGAVLSPCSGQCVVGFQLALGSDWSGAELMQHWLQQVWLYKVCSRHTLWHICDTRCLHRSGAGSIFQKAKLGLWEYYWN